MSEERYDEEEYEDDVENSAEDEYEEEYSDDAEASDEEAIDGTEEAADGDMEHVEWGFETKKRRFSKEVVLGLVAVLGLVGVFGFVVHNQFSGDGEQVASTGDEGTPSPEGTLGAEGDPNAATDPFADGQPGTDDPIAAQPDENALVQNGQDKPSPDEQLNGLLSDQFEPGLDGQPGAGGAGDSFLPGGDSFESSEPTAPATENMNVASRDSVFGGPATFESQPVSDPFVTEPAAAGSLPDPDPLLSQNDPSGLGTELPAATLPETSLPDTTLPDGDLLSGNPSVGVGSSANESFGAEPFGSEPFVSEPAVTSGQIPAGERPRGLFDDGPVGGNASAGNDLAGGQGDAFGSGFASENSPGQPGSLGEPRTSDPGLPSGPTGLASDSLPPIAGDGGLSSNDPLPQPSLDSNQPSLDPAPLGNEPLLGNSEPSPVMLGNDLLPGDARSGTLSEEPFGTEPAGDFKAPVVAEQNDPFGSNGFDSPSALGSPGGLESPAGSATTARSATAIGAGNSIGAGNASGRGVGGSTYTVEEADSFWSISKKVYGTSQYFEALQKYNRAKVDDPKKLKPGMVLDTPSASILADYLDDGTAVSPQAIADGGRSRSSLPTAADNLPTTVGTSRSPDSPAGFSGGILPIEPAGEPETVQTVASSPSATTIGDSTKAGFFIGNQGYPMYRVANGDTLTAIAADHLGRASRWKQIFRMNQEALKSPDKLAPGVVLKLPGDASRVPLIDRTSSLR